MDNRRRPLFEDGQVVLESMKTLASAETYENDALFHLRMKLDFKDAEWYGVGVSSTRPLNYAWSDNGLYHLVIKESQFELQKWGNGGGGANQVVVQNNGLVKDGEYFDFKMGAIPRTAGCASSWKSTGSASCRGWIRQIPLTPRAI